jgi:hypothetical protein
MEKINRDGHVLLFKGEEFDMDQVLGQAKSGPPIEVKLDELNLVGLNKLAADEEEAKRLIARHHPVRPEYVEQGIVFYKQEGKYTVLLGHIKIRQALEEGKRSFKGRLISGPALKKTKIEKPVAYTPPAPQPAPTPQFNAPRFDDRRRPSTTGTDRRDPAPRRGLENNRPSYGERTQQRTSSPSSNNRTITRGDFRKS